MKLARLAVLLIGMGATIAGGKSALADLNDAVGLWQFDGNLDNSINGLQPLVANGFTPTYTTSMIGGQSANVANLPAFLGSQTLTMMANLGGHRTNEYTLIMDVNVPSLGTFTSLVQSDSTNTTDTDFYVRSNGAIGTNFTSDISPAGSVAAGTWHRIAIRRSPTNPGIVAFVDGTPGTAGNGFGVNDSVFSLPGLTHLFSDQNSDTSAILVNSVAYYAEALSNAEIASLGGATAAGFSAPASSNAPAPVSSWDLNGSLANGTNPAEPLTANGFTPGYTTSTINGQSATVLDLPALNSAQTLTVANSIGANGGGAFTNEWALAMDVNFQSISPYLSLVQTNVSNGNDTDVYLNADGTLVLSSAGGIGDSGTFNTNEWVRLVISQEADAANGNLITEAYLNGALVGSATNTLDGAMSLDTLFHLFSDDNGNTSPSLVNSIAFFDQGLTPFQIQALGGPSAQGIAADITAQTQVEQVPEPGSMMIWLLGGLIALVGLTRRKFA